MTKEFPNDFKELLKSLNKNKVRYLIVGGYAVGLHGHIRATKDIDIWVAVAEENLEKIRASLVEFGFPEARDLSFGFGKMIRMGFPPFRIELLSKLSGVEFEECYPNRQVMQVEDIEISVIDLADLRKNKKASGRLQDLADLERLPEALDK